MFDNHKGKSRNDTIKINKDFYTSLYRHYWKRRFVFDQKYKARLFYQFIERLKISLEGLHVLEYGFGYGNILLSLPRSCKLYGIDLVPEAVKNAEAVARKLGFFDPSFFVEKGRLRFPIESETIDLVICSHVLEHVLDDDVLLGEFRRVMKNGGYLIFLCPVNEAQRDPNHVRETDLDYFQLKSNEFDFKVVDSWTSDRIFPYTTSYWVKRYHEKLVPFGRLGSIALNLLFSAVPHRILDEVEKALERNGKQPHQLLVCLRKNAQ